jgi:hypothetical protein
MIVTTRVRLRIYYRLIVGFYWGLPLPLRGFFFFAANIILASLFVEWSTAGIEFEEDFEGLALRQFGLGGCIFFAIWWLYPRQHSDFFRQATNSGFKFIFFWFLIRLPPFVVYTAAIVLFRYIDLPLTWYPYLGILVGLLLAPTALLLSPFRGIERIIERWQIGCSSFTFARWVNAQYWLIFIVIYLSSGAFYRHYSQKEYLSWYKETWAADFNRWLSAYKFEEVVFLFFIYLCFSNVQVVLVRYSSFYNGHYFHNISRKLRQVDECLTLIERIDKLEKDAVYGGFLIFLARQLRYFIGREISLAAIMQPFWCEVYNRKLERLSEFSYFATHFDSFLKLVEMSNNRATEGEALVKLHQKLVPILQTAEVVFIFLERFDDAFSHWELLRIAGRLRAEKPELLQIFLENRHSLEDLESIVPFFQATMYALLDKEDKSYFASLDAVQALFDRYCCAK